MPADGEVDYSRYTADQLNDAAHNVDRGAFPQNFERLRQEIARRNARAREISIGDAPSAATVPESAPVASDDLSESPAANDAIPPDLPPGAALPQVVEPPWDAGPTLQPQFHANGKEYFRIWIVNLALTILTIGIYSAWAKVRKLRYFYSNTALAESVFGYHAEPMAILKGRIIAVCLAGAYFAATRISLVATFIIALGIAAAMPWLIVRSRQFSLRMTSWRGIRFGFQNDYAGAYRAMLGWIVLAILTLGILMPRAARERFQFLISRTQYGSTAFNCNPSTGRFYKTAFAAAGILIGLLVIIGILAGVSTLVLPGAIRERTVQVATVVLYVGLFSYINAYVQARNLNEVYGTTTLGPHRVRCQLSARKLGSIYLTNLLGIVFTLGLFTPWAQIRVMRYRIQCLQLQVHGSLDEFVAGMSSSTAGATGGELTNILDVDLGL